MKNILKSIAWTCWRGTLSIWNRFTHRYLLLVGIHYEQLDEFRNLVMLESAFGRILRSSVNAGRAEKTELMLMPHMFLQRIDLTTKMMFKNFGTQKFYLDNYLNSIKKYSNGRYDLELPLSCYSRSFHCMLNTFV